MHTDRPVTNVQLADALCEVSVPLREARRVHVEAYGNFVPHVSLHNGHRMQEVWLDR